LSSSAHTASTVQRTRCGEAFVCSCGPRAEHSLFCFVRSARPATLLTCARTPPLRRVCIADTCAHVLRCRLLCVLQSACTSDRREQEAARRCCWSAVASRCVGRSRSLLVHAPPLHGSRSAHIPPLQTRHQHYSCLRCVPCSSLTHADERRLLLSPCTSSAAVGACGVEGSACGAITHRSGVWTRSGSAAPSLRRRPPVAALESPPFRRRCCISHASSGSALACIVLCTCVTTHTSQRR
jgi:hypothetical protein